MSEWFRCDEFMPIPYMTVLVYSPPTKHDWPGTVNIQFDHIDLDYQGWYQHGENYEHFCAVAGGMEDCIGPSENASYTHWAYLLEPPRDEADQ